MARKKDKEPPLKRGDLYYVPGAEPHVSVGSVTKEVNLTEPIKWWAHRRTAEIVTKEPGLTMAEYRSEFAKRGEKAPDRGKMLHSWFEAQNQGNTLDPDDLPSDSKGAGQAFLEYTEAMGHRIILPEVVVVNSTYGYAGRADAFVFDASGKIVIVDYKTGKDVYPWEDGLQQGAYRGGEYLLDNKTREPIDKGADLLKEVSYTMTVHLKPNGTWQVARRLDLFTDFLFYLHIFRKRREVESGEAMPCWKCWCQDEVWSRYYIDKREEVADATEG